MSTAKARKVKNKKQTSSGEFKEFRFMRIKYRNSLGNISGYAIPMTASSGIAKLVDRFGFKIDEIGELIISSKNQPKDNFLDIQIEVFKSPRSDMYRFFVIGESEFSFSLCQSFAYFFELKKRKIPNYFCLLVPCTKKES